MKTHHLKHRQDKTKEMTYVDVTRSYNTSNNSMETHRLKKNKIGGEKRDMWWLYSQPNTSNNSMKLTH